MDSKRYPLIRVRDYLIRKSGRGYTVALPSSWVEDLGANAGDTVSIYRDTSDRLIIVPAKKTKGAA